MKKFLISEVILLFGILIHANAQESKVSGRVSAAKEGIALPGVSVQIKNATKGTMTDADGNYSLTLNSDTDTLIFSFIGYATKQEAVNRRNQVNVQLESETTELKEVVITGFQEVERKLFTGSSTTVKMSDIKMSGITDASQMLEGRVAGVTVDNVSGTFGTSPKIRIRGNTSINGNTQPLMVVDGVILEDLSATTASDILTGNANTLTASSIAGLNPDDILSQNILKDASATALYGTRAKNGVIVITTKKGRAGETRINYSGNFSIHLRPTYGQFDIMNSADEMSVYREMYEKGLIDITTAVKAPNYGAMGKMFSEINDKEINWGNNGYLNEKYLHEYESANTDWFGVLYKDYSLQQQHSLSFTTGTDKHTSYYSLSFLNDNGQSVADKVKRYIGTAKNSFQFTKKLLLDLKLTGNFRQQQVPGSQQRDFDPITGRFKRDFDINPFNYALNTSRSMRAYDSEGNLEYFRRNFAPFNILKEIELNYITINVGDISTQADINYDIKENLLFKSTLQIRSATTRREHVIHENSNQAEAYRADDTQYIQDANPLLFEDPNNPGQKRVVLPEGGFNNIEEDQLKYYYIRNSLNWSRTINTLHSINILAGQEIKYLDRSYRRADGIGVVYESGGIVNTDPSIIEFLNAQGISTSALSINRERFAGVFINGAYSFNEKYVFNGTIRYDGTNRLGKINTARYLPTWNISGAWNIDKAGFIDYSWLNYLKLRATYGLTANLDEKTSAELTLRPDVTLRPNDVESFLYIESLKNNNLTWEKLKEFNIGLDFGIYDNRITGTLDAYNRNAFDLIGILQTSGVGGNAYKLGNYGDMKTHGIEFALSTVNYTGHNFSWVTSFNVSYARDKITRLKYNPRLGDAIVQDGAAVLGGPRRGLFSTKFAGLDNQGIPTFYNNNGEVVHNYDLQDRDNITTILKYEGSAEPRGAGGLSNIFTYKSFSLNVFLSYKFDYKIRLNDAFNPVYTDFNSFSKSFKDRWVVPGDEQVTNVPVILDQATVGGNNSDKLSAYDLYNKSTARVADGTYVRLKSVRLAYNLPKNIIRKIGARTAQLSIEGQNLALLYTDKLLKGQDPEFFNTGGVAMPQPKLITTAISIGF